MSLRSIEEGSLELRKHRAKATPQHLGQLRDQLDRRMVKRLIRPETPGIPVGRFEAVMNLGSGGYGCVVEAWDPKLERAVALKLCVNDKPEATALLLAEAQTLASLSHPNIITIHDTGHYEDSLFLVMEFAGGQSLTRRALGDDQMPWRRLVPIFADVARGLAAAHGEGVIHGDIKPSNILLRGDGRPLVADFGLARIVGAPPLLPNAIGTLPYAAPEVLRGADRDPLSDQWSFFVTLWECIDRRLPFISNRQLQDELLMLTEADMLRLIERWVWSSAKQSEVSKILLEALAVGLSLEPSERFPNMYAVADALDHVVSLDWAAVMGTAPAMHMPIPEKLAEVLFVPDMDAVAEADGVSEPPIEEPAADDGVVVVPTREEPRSARRIWKKGGLAAFLLAAGLGLVGEAYLLGQRQASESAHHEQRALDSAERPSLEESTPCVSDDVPIEPDANVQAMCRVLRTDGHQAAVTLWEELSESRVLKARSSRDWLKLACDTTVLAQTFLHEVDTADPERAKQLREATKQLARFAKQYVSRATGDETAEAVSQVKSIIAGVTETSTN